MRLPIVLLAAGATILSASAFADATSSLKAGNAQLKSAGALAFGPDGVLFVGDSVGSAIYALDTGDRTPRTKAPAEIQGINDKIAAMLGVARDQVLINDVAVDPLSKNVYLSVSRGRGPDAQPVILRTDAAGKLSELSLTAIKHARVALPNPVGEEAKDRRGESLRQETITHLGYVDGKVLVAGITNEEFASNLRSIPFPFDAADRGAGIRMYHGSHGRYETDSPVRTFVPYRINNQAYILAAYTCTPLVKILVSDLKAGNKIEGTTISEFGARNRPLDMIVYNKAGVDYILMANSDRGVMRMATTGIEKYGAITSHTELAGLPYTTLPDLKGVEQLDRVDDSKAIVLVRADTGVQDLKTIALN